MSTLSNQIILLENNQYSPGICFEESLIYGGIGGILNEMVSINESTDYSKPLKFRGKFQEADAVNKNKRMYPFEILDKNVKVLHNLIDENGLCGELDHPSDSIIHFKEVSHKITKLWWEGNVLMGEGVILSTPCGRVLRSLINDGVRIGISSRGVGNGKVNENGVLVIGESFKLITFDAVADPSTYAAFQEKVVSNKKESVIPNNYTNFSPKNESSSININKDALLACLGGVINQQTKNIKKRLSNG